MLYEIICWNVASGFSYLYVLGPSRVCRDMAARGRGSTLLWRLKVCNELKKGKGKLLRCGLVASWKAFTSIPVAKTLRHISCLLQGIFSPFLSTDFYPSSFFFISFRWKDQIRSSVKIARQRFAWQGISFCYLYWNIIRFTLSPFSHLHLHFQLHFHLNFHFTDALLKIDSDRMRERKRER